MCVISTKQRAGWTLTDKKGNVLLIMRTVNTKEDTLTHVVLWVCTLIIAFFAWLEKTPLMLLYLSAPFVLASMIFAFYKVSKRVIVTEDHIETQFFYCFAEN